MTARQRGGDRGERGDRRERGRRAPSDRSSSRTPPDAATGREAQWFFRRRDEESTVTVHLGDGTSHSGVIEYYDRDLVKLVPPRGPGLLLRKSEIRYITDAD
jgi:hypothetical protein